MKRASQVSRGRHATATSQLIDGILAAATAAGLVDSARVEALRAGVSARSVEVQTSGRVAETALLWLWGALADIAGGHRVGAELAPFAGPSAWGVVAEAAVHAVSLTDAFERVARYVRLAVEGVRIGVDVKDRSFTVTYRLLGSGANPSSGAAAAAMLWANANLALLPERAFAVRLRPVSAELACVAPGDTGGVIADIFGTDVKFGTADWRLVFERAAVLAVARPIASSALAYIDAYADRALSDAPAIDDIVGLVATEIRGRLAGGPPTLAGIAGALGLSTRTLQRRLAIAGRSFEAVLDEVRRARAKALLADGGRDLAEIAYKLGYSDRSAFTRAAIRWFGVPPSAMR
ncbi:MAG: helix-turn-helix domain-containing protein [Xanthobacteraceae bacterium]